MTTFEQRIKAQLGELLFSNMHIAAEAERLTVENARQAEEINGLKNAAEPKSKKPA